MYINVTYLTLTPGEVPGALKILAERHQNFGLEGRFVSAFFSEIGALNRILLLHAHEDPAALVRDQQRVTTPEAPLGIAEHLDEISCELFTTFPDTGVTMDEWPAKFYEVRTYRLHSGGIAPTLAAWQAVLEARQEISPLHVVMHSVSGPTRFMHIWPYHGFDDRMGKRGKAVEAGIWPPPGGLPHIKSMQSELFLPAGFVPRP